LSRGFDTKYGEIENKKYRENLKKAIDRKKHRNKLIDRANLYGSKEFLFQFLIFAI